MNENKVKVCRFCLHEEKCDDTNTNKVLHIFESELDEDLIRKIGNYTQIAITPGDKIPPNICTTCVELIVNFDKFLDCCWKSQKVLNEIYDVPNQINQNVDSERSKSNISNEQTLECTPEGSKLVNNKANSSKIGETGSDDSDSDFSSIKEEKAPVETRNMRKAKVLKIDESVKQIIGDNTYNCKICSEEFKSFFEYQDHQETHNGQLVFSCTKCDQVFSDRKELVEHDANHKVACQVCNKMVLPKSLSAHLKKHTDLYRCPECDLTHTSKPTLEKHIQARHAGQKGLVCHICGKQSSCQASLNRHLTYHSADRPYKCKYCNFSTKSQGILKIHTSRKHLGVEKSCEECGKTFKSEINLKQHIKRIHNVRKHVCHICQKAFVEKYRLEKHILRKHSKQNVHECKVCNVEFQTVRELKQHMHTHRHGCVTCPNCGKQFFYKKFLERHMTKCSPDKPNENFRDKLQRLKSTISLPSSTSLLER